MNNSFFNVLRYPNFKKIWFSQVYSQIALNILTFALVLHIFDLTGKATSISLVMIASAIPVAIIGPFSGVLADKVNIKKILLYTNLLRFFAVVLLLLGKNNVLASLEIIFLISAISQVFTPAEQAAIPMVVPKDKLVEANSTVLTTTYITLLVGYSIAGPLMQFMSVSWLFVLCAILYLIAAFFTKGLSDFDKKESRKLNIENLAHSVGRVWEEARLGMGYLFKEKTIIEPMIKLTVGWIILGALITLLPSYGSQVLNINPKFIGPLVIAPAGLGMLISIALLNKKKNKTFDKLINAGFFIVACALIVFSLFHFYQTSSIARIILFTSILILGFGCSMIQIPAQTLLHLNADEDKRGRVFGISSMQLRLATSLPALVVGGISDLTSPLVTMILLSVTVFIYAMILVFE